VFTSLRNIFRFRALKRVYTTHERVLVPLMLLIGVIIDFVTFHSIEASTAFFVLGIYAVIAAVMILIIHRYDASQTFLERPTPLGYVRLVAPLVVQFTFGALLSAALIFYWFSGSFSVSWPLFVVVLALMVGNEQLREHYLRPTVQLSVFYFILFATLATALPSLIGSISPSLFVAAGLASLVIMFIYVSILYRFRPDLRLMKPSPTISVFFIFVAMNAAYFLNIIPPIPLSIVESGVYLSVQRQGGEYILVKQERTFLERLMPGNSIDLELGQRVYVFASIFAPIEINTTVTHDWQYFSDQGWKSVSRLSYNMIGGREEGYRGYSYITSHMPGKWRVDVKTQRGQVIGRIAFEIR
jgi:hypothetical protein